MAKRNLPYGGATPMDPGERDAAVTIQQLTEGAGASNFPTESWSTLRTPVWMRRRTLRMSERFTAGQNTAAADDQWEMGYAEDMDPELVDVTKVRRLIYQSRIYEITGASMIGRREGIELMTVTGQRVTA